MRKTVAICLTLLLLFSADTLRAAKKAQKVPDPQKELKDKINKYLSSYRPDGQRVRSASRLQTLLINDSLSTIEVVADSHFGEQVFTPQSVEHIYSSIGNLLPDSCQSYILTVKSGGRDIRDLVPNRLRRDLDEKRMWGDIDYQGRPWVSNASLPYKVTNGLQNRHLSLWASHGRYFHIKDSVWKWQRPSLFGTREDLFTQTIVVPYLIPMLEKAGAIVFTPRERDWQRHEVIVDNDMPHTRWSSYQETIGSHAWSQTDSVGFAYHQGNYLDGENPFLAGTARQTETVDHRRNQSLASYIPTIPETGRYAVYVSYQTVEGSIDDAHYTVWHQGVPTEFRVNQQMGGSTWVYLGTFDFDEGSSAQNCVVLSNQSRSRGIVTTDAVRFGGGMGNIRRGYTTSGLPRCLEGARYYAQWAGMPYEVYSSKNGEDDYGDDINVRSHMTNLLAGGSCYMPDTTGRHVPIELSLAVHSDAGYTRDGSHTGTLAICTTYLNDSILGTGMSRLASRDLADELLVSVSNDIKRKYANWQMRELFDRNYSETRCPEVPSAILETMSHQNFADMRYGQDPNFRFDLARSIYKALLRYISRMHQTTYTVSPLTPNKVRVELTGKGEVKLSWAAVKDPLEPSAVPTGYIVYTAIGKGGFDNGQYIQGTQTSCTIDVTPGELYSFRVTAVNAGGESFPSEVVSACDVPEAQKTVLIVNGFHRLSSPFVRDNAAEQGFDLEEDPGVTYGRTAGWLGYQTCFNKATMGRESKDGLGYTNDTLQGQFIAGNDFDYIRTHAEAIAATQRYSIASCSAEALETNEVYPTQYNMLDLILGLERNDGYSLRHYQTFSPMLKEHLRLFASHGGALLVSGSYVGSDMQMPADRRFLEDVLKCYGEGVNRDSLQRDTISGLGTTFEFYRHLNETHYAATHPDILQPVAPAYSAMIYTDGYSACVAYDGSDYKAMTLGFPFECIKSEQKRQMLMRGILRFLLQSL